MLVAWRGGGLSGSRGILRGGLKKRRLSCRRDLKRRHSGLSRKRGHGRGLEHGRSGRRGVNWRRHCRNDRHHFGKPLSQVLDFDVLSLELIDVRLVFVCQLTQRLNQPHLHARLLIQRHLQLSTRLLRRLKRQVTSAQILLKSFDVTMLHV